MKVLAFGGSYSPDSINKKLATYVASKFEADNEVEILDLTNYELPVFTVTKMNELGGAPQEAKNFYEKIKSADLIILSVSEYNGNLQGAFKNLIDWVSIVEQNFFEGKKFLLTSTAPGPYAGKNALGIAEAYFGRHGDVITTFSLPEFDKNFDVESGKISNQELDSELNKAIEKVKSEM